MSHILRDLKQKSVLFVQSRNNAENDPPASVHFPGFCLVSKLKKIVFVELFIALFVRKKVKLQTMGYQTNLSQLCSCE